MKLFVMSKASSKIKNLDSTDGDELKYAFKVELVSPVATTLKEKSPKLSSPLKIWKEFVVPVDIIEFSGLINVTS